MTIQSLLASKKAFKQQERMVDRIRGLITDYPLSATIKELLQNADDAGATRLHIWFDWRSHALINSQDKTIARLGGPALLAYNDRQFKKDDVDGKNDFDGIQNVGRGAKATNRSKLGRFGVGFCSVYNLTDYPCLVSGDQFAICDPHGHLFPPDEGGRWNLRDLWVQYPELLIPFCDAGLERGRSEFPGTIFRFPLRDGKQVAISEVSPQEVGQAELDSIGRQVKKYGASYLLFLKNVLHIKLCSIDTEGRETRIFSIRTENADEVKRNRDSVTKTLILGHAELFSLLRNSTAPLDPVCYQHNMQVDTSDTAVSLSWQVCQGVFCDPGHQLVDLAEKLAPPGTQIVDKAVPWAGVAALLHQGHGNELHRPHEPAALEGLVFCGLPLGFCADLQPEQRLPVHIHGFFDLDTSRYAPAANPEEAGKGALGVRWNQLLVEHAIAPAYAALLSALTGPVGGVNPERFYALWPPVPCQLPGSLSMLGEVVYRLLNRQQVVRRAGTLAWVVPTELWLPPAGLQAPLSADQCPIPEPPLPSRIVDGLHRATVPMKHLTPATLCIWLRDESFPRTPIRTAKRPSLRQRSWLVALLKFCLTDPQTQLKGLPLALLADGTLAAFSPGYKTFLCSKEEHEILAPFAHALIAYEYGIECGLKQQTDSGLYRIEFSGVIGSITGITGELSSSSSVPWSPNNAKPPNARWLVKVFKYLRKSKELVAQKSRLQQVPLVPDQYNHLRPMGTDLTPLLCEDGELGTLRTAIDTVGIPRVVGPSELLAEVNQFAREQGPQFVRTLNPETLVSMLKSFQTALAGLSYQSTVHDVLLSYLLPWYASQPNKSSILKVLTIFPTVSGAVTAIQNVSVFLAPGFALPRCLDRIVTLYEGPQYSWRTALEAIGVPRLNHATIIQTHLLPAYAQLDLQSRYEALRWVRDHFAAALGEVMQYGGASSVDAFNRQIRAAALIRAGDDKWYPADRLYHPDKCGLPDVLSGRVLFPHREQYAHERERWLGFFSVLGLNNQPHPLDLLECVRHLSTRAQSEGISTVTAPLKDIWEHLQEHGKDLLKEPLSGHAGGTTGTLAQALRGLAWLPARRTQSELAAYPGARVPAARLFSPEEIHLTSSGYLVASQANLLLFEEPRSFLREALHIPLHPVLDKVMDHFEYLLTQWELPQHGGLSAEGLRKAIALIYRVFGLLLRDPSNDSEREKQVVADLNRLRSRFGNRECIWVNSKQIFVSPMKAFASAVHGLGAKRFGVRITNESEDRGLIALGRRSAPEREDYISYLRELQANSGEQPLTLEGEQQALEALQHLSLLMVQSSESPPTVPLLTRKGLLVDSCDVIVNHDKWYDEYSSIDDVHLLHERVPPGLITSLRLRKLTEEIDELPVGVFRESTNAQLIEQAQQWSTTLRTQEFRAALLRLIRHYCQFARASDLQWLDNVTVCIVKPIRAQLWIKQREDPARCIGTTDSSSYFRPENTTIYLSDQEPILAASFLATELNRQLDDLCLPTVSELVQLFGVPPQRMDQVLTKLRVSIDFEARAQEAGAGTTNQKQVVVEEWRGTEETSDVEASTAVDGQLSKEQRPASEGPVDDSKLAPPDATALDAADSTEHEEAQSEVAAPISPTPASSPLSPSRGGYVHHVPTVSRPSSGYHGVSGGGGSSSPIPPMPSDTMGTPGDGRSHAPYRPLVQSGRLVSYVFPEGIANWYAELGLDEEHWLSIQQHGIERVQREEGGTERRFRAAQEGNPGYSLVSELLNGEDIRYHLVKALPGPWADAGVALSNTEHRVAQQLGASFWLHVVEYAMDDQDGPYTVIQDPASKIMQFRLDRGWKAAGVPETAPAVPLIPEVGQTWRHTSLGEAEILKVVGGGQHKRLQVRWRTPSPGQPPEQWLTFIRSQMQLVLATE